MFDYKSFLRTLSEKPGIYQMVGQQGQLLYVGKAKNLKKRVSSYFIKRSVSTKTEVLIKQIVQIKVIVTRSENEALILENNLIKRHRPRYNVLFRDDKSYPYIYLSSHQSYPRLDFYRGRRRGPGRFFGPYPSTKAVRQTLNLLQKLFKIRSCRDSFFRYRTRPCLQYQIGRCTAPCVGFTTVEQYQQNVNHAVMVLTGKEESVVSELTAKMAEHSRHQQYEQAAQCRNQIASIRRLQTGQHAVTNVGDVDVIVGLWRGGVVCIQVLIVRHGQILGKRSFFPHVPVIATKDEVFSAFVSQYYLDQSDQLPTAIIFKRAFDGAELFASALSQRVQQTIKLIYSPRGERAGLLAMAELNAKEAMSMRLADRSNIVEQFEALERCLALEQPIARVDCFDVSHSQGEATVASCVVFGLEGAMKSAWRRFNITGVTKGDDYGAMKQALTRHYTRLKRDEIQLPDLVIIDGGRGQMKQAQTVFEQLQISHLPILGIAKGPTRRAGEETLYFTSDNQKVTQLSAPPLAQYLLQHIRDEAHRFAIMGHRQQRKRRRQQSPLQAIPGIGAKRRQQLLHYFGGLQGVQQASVDDLIKVPGISQQLAQAIYQYLNG